MTRHNPKTAYERNHHASNSQGMKYLSLFSGIGGFELGIEQADEELCIKNTKQRLQGIGNTKRQCSECFDICSHGLTCIGYSEIDPYAIQIYERHFTHKNYGDITKINAKELPDFDLLVGGFPCQSFSIAGKRAGFADTRGTMFFEIARIIREKQPRLLLLENVKGLLSHDQGATFYTIISTLDELRYDLGWQVLNSKNFGVPQNRERVFIVGHLRGTPRPQVFPLQSQSEKADGIQQEKQTQRQRVQSKISPEERSDERLEKRRRLCGRPHSGVAQMNHPKHSNNRVYGASGISPTLNTMQGGMRQPFIAPTVIAEHHNTTDVHFVGEPPKIRRLTPTECERLQGFPDGWTKGVSDSRRYKALGNAVTVNVVQEIMKKIRRHT